jgi:uncharacterized protein YyaL (SSP411 family)
MSRAAPSVAPNRRPACVGWGVVVVALSWTLLQVGCGPDATSGGGAPVAADKASASEPAQEAVVDHSLDDSTKTTTRQDPTATDPAGPPGQDADPKNKQAPAGSQAAGSQAAGSQAAGNQAAGDTAKRPRNRLADETSPYLLLHAHNPVDWYPWGDEALAKAKRENKVIFLSVGYSSCHWCHVMERESFMDKEIAEYLNEHFVCIKVDREERPDVDSIYMTAVQIVAQRGGWPMSVFLTPDAKPFFGGTYFPARDNDRPGMTGFLTLLQRVQEIWVEQPDQLRQDADRLTEMLKRQLDGRRPGALEPPDAVWLDRLQEALADQYDETYGGFGFVEADPRRPKFPEPSNLVFLLDRARRLPADSPQRKQALELVEGTLQRMAMGGIRDHLGGGFHRYSVDRFWKIPHFEKMLYDNGQLASVYSEAYRLTGREEFRLVVEQLLDFVLREMTGPDGGFYSALDAESEDEEGKFYRWEKAELQQVLDAETFAQFAEIYGLDEPPNFEESFYALQLGQTLTKLAEDRGVTVEQLDEQLAPSRRKLLEARTRRPRPLTDDKILTGWNGLMIRGFADAGRILKQPRYVEAAERAARFVLRELRDDQGRLLRTYGQGRAKLNAYLNDYAFLVDGLIGLYEATQEAQWLEEAERLTDRQIELFWDDANNGFFFTSGDHESLLARIRDPVDGAQPSGNSVSAQNLLFLSQARNRPEYLDKAEQTILATSGLLQTSPLAAPRMAVAVARWHELRPQPATEPPKSQPDQKTEKPATDNSDKPAGENSVKPAGASPEKPAAKNPESPTEAPSGKNDTGAAAEEAPPAP